MRKIITIALSLLAFGMLSAYQEPDWDSIENFLEDNFAEEEISSALDQIEYYFRNPIKIKFAAPDALSYLPTIDLAISQKIIERFQSNPQLSYVGLFDSLNLSKSQEQIIYFATSLDTTAVDKQSKNSLKYSARSENRLEEVRGLREGKYLGDRYDILQKFNYKHSSGLEANGVVCKNLGEIHLAEYYSLGAKYQSGNFKIIVGDYALNSGFGNVLWQPFSMSKGSELISAPISYSNSMRLNNSTMLLSHFRGAAIEYTLPFGRQSVKLIPFYSNILRAATVDTSKGIASSIYSAGYFRTQSEISKKGALREISSGAIAELSGSRYKIGFALLNIGYSIPIKSSSGSAIEGSSSMLATSFAMLNFGKITFGAEHSRNQKNEFATKIVYSYRSNLFSASLHYRDYSAKFRSPYGYNFGESATPSNEQGLYFGILYKVAKDVSIESYFDIYRTHTRTYTVQMPVSGRDWCGRAFFDNTLFGNLMLKLKSETKTDGYKASSSSAQTIFDITRDEIRLEAKRSISEKVAARARLDFAYIDFDKVKPGEVGWAGFIELEYKPLKNLRVKARTSVFATDSYSSAIWHFEYRMPGSGYANALYEDGNRTLLAIDYKPTNFIALNFAYTRLEKYNKSKLGSGYSETLGNQDNRLYFQLTLNL